MGTNMHGLTTFFGVPAQIGGQKGEKFSNIFPNGKRDQRERNMTPSLTNLNVWSRVHDAVKHDNYNPLISRMREEKLDRHEFINPHQKKSSI